MTTPIFPTTWYWVVSDTNPTTQVWESSSGSFVSNSGVNYQSWVANGGRSTNGPVQVNVLGAANNGSGVVRLTVDRLQDMATNDKWVVQNVGGTVEANGTQTIIIVSAVAPFTIDLQGVAFVHVYTSGGVADRGTVIDTAAHLYSSINSFNLTLPIPKYTSIALSGSPTAISLPLALVTDVIPNTSDGAVLSLPQANLFGSPPVGQPFTLVGQGSGSTIHNWILKDFGGNTIGTFGSNEGVIVWNTSNASSAGTWEGFRTRNVTPPAGDAQILTSGSSWQQTLVWLASTPSGDVSMADGGVFTVTGCVKTVKTQTFTGSGTYTPSTGMRYCTIEAVGGGGGGGGAVTPNNLDTFAGGGGGAGGYSRLTASAATIGASQTVTIGGGGNGGVAGANNGSNGVDTSVGTLCIGKAGSGGLFGSQAQVGQGGAGGVAGTGNITSAGTPGGNGIYENAASSISLGSGFGGSSFFGGGAQPVGSGGAVNGNNAGNYGGGGSGGLANGPGIGGAGNAAGGNGSAGFVIITEYCNQ